MNSYLLTNHLVVIIVVVADTVDQIVDIANESAYSLSAAVWTKNINTALDVASRIRAGKSEIPSSFA